LAHCLEIDLGVGLSSAETIEGMADAFLAGGDPRHPLASPLHADLSGFCPLYIQVGGDETLLVDSTRLAERAGHAGVDDTHERARIGWRGASGEPSLVAVAFWAQIVPDTGRDHAENEPQWASNQCGT
jgi:acetyl esterase/lipase